MSVGVGRTDRGSSGPGERAIKLGQWIELFVQLSETLGFTET